LVIEDPVTAFGITIPLTELGPIRGLEPATVDYVIPLPS
jgi:hypothetical protein